MYVYSSAQEWQKGERERGKKKEEAAGRAVLELSADHVTQIEKREWPTPSVRFAATTVSTVAPHTLSLP